MPVLKLDTCKSFFRKENAPFTVNENQHICAGGNGPDACYVGDQYNELGIIFLIYISLIYK